MTISEIERKGLGHRILHFPLTKILIGLLVVGGIVAIAQIGTQQLTGYIPMNIYLRGLIIGIITASVSIITYKWLFRFYEKRTISELSLHRIWRYVGAGIALGFVLQTLTILVIYLNDGLTVVSINPVYYLLPAFTMAITSAIAEEILVRGIIFRILEEKLGSYVALFISAFIFGALHLANPNSSVAAATGLALQAGLFLAAAFIFSRNLWFPIAIHFAWNFTQGGIYGAAVSGSASRRSLLTTKIEGAEWFTGGQFGPEGSVQATLFCLLATIILLTVSHRQNKIVEPAWKNRRDPVLP